MDLIEWLVLGGVCTVLLAILWFMDLSGAGSKVPEALEDTRAWSEAKFGGDDSTSTEGGSSEN